MTGIRAKFYCETILKDASGNETTKLRAVTAGSSKENADWSKWTPSGDLCMTVSNPDAHGFFKPGREYFLTFVEALKQP